jgi:hypothetical protein
VLAERGLPTPNQNLIYLELAAGPREP